MITNKQIKCVYYKTDQLNNIYRTPELELIAGERITKVSYKENGMALYFDIEQTFFCTRLQFERKRLINKYIKDKQIICDVFAGIGPLSIMSY